MKPIDPLRPNSDFDKGWPKPCGYWPSGGGNAKEPDVAKI